MSSPLPRSTPEDVGIPSSAVTAFVEALRRSGQEIHSFMLVRGGQVAAEAWWKPYAPDLPHSFHSLSKSFTGTAVGLAVAEGKVSVDDPVLRYFPEDAPRRPSANLQALRVRHLLSMSTGHEADTLRGTERTRNWARFVLSKNAAREPGTLFVYNSGAIYLLSAIVQKASGQRLLEYLTPRLFDPLGIEGATWDRCPRGIDMGLAGLSGTTEDIAKFGLLYLRRGIWNGRRLLPESWVAEATRSHIPCAGSPGVIPATPDTSQGYGYCFWICRHGAFMGHGWGGQLCVVMPEQDAVLAVTAGTSDTQAILDAVWDTLLPALGGQPKVVKERQRELRKTLRSLRLDPPAFRDDPAAAAAIDGKGFDLEANPPKLRSVSFAFAADRLLMKVRGRRTTLYRCGPGKWVASKGRPEPSPVRKPIPMRCAYTWLEDGRLEVTNMFITSPVRVTYRFRFSGDALELGFSPNIGGGGVIRGRPSVQGPAGAAGAGSAADTPVT